MVVALIVSIVLAIVLTIMGVTTVMYCRKVTRLHGRVSELANEKRFLDEKVAAARNTLNETVARCNFLEGQNAAYEEKNSKMIANETKISMLEAQVPELEDRVGLKKCELAQIESKIAEKQTQLDNLNLRATENWNAIEKAREELGMLEKGAEELRRQISGLELEIRKYQDELSSLKSSYRVALGIGELKGYRFTLSQKEIKLIELINEIIEKYPDLQTELCSILGSKIGLPKAKVMCMEMGVGDEKVIGVYRLKLDDQCSYVGQAINIKERGYQHIKKMIGAEKCGNEKIYDYSPEMFEGEVLEICDASHLNERERYWIEFFGCREKGLNSR